MRAMATEGYTSEQIAASLGLSLEGCRATLRREKIDLPADRVMKGRHRHDSNRIVEAIVIDAENLTTGINLIDFSSLDRTRLREWVRSLHGSKRALGLFHRRLIKERDSVEAAEA